MIPPNYSEEHIPNSNIKESAGVRALSLIKFIWFQRFHNDSSLYLSLSLSPSFLSPTHLESIVYPGAQLEDAGLVVEGEVGDVHRAGGAELGRWRPEHLAFVSHHGFALHVSPSVVIRTGVHGEKAEVYKGRDKGG